LFFEIYNILGSRSLFANEDFKNIVKASPSFELFNLYHGMGHSFYEITHDLENSFHECDIVGMGDNARALMCFYGVSHEFSFYSVYTNKSLVALSSKCDHDPLKKRACLYMLGQTFGLENIQKTAQDCSKVNERACFVGLAAVLDIPNREAKEAEKQCISLFPKEMHATCYEGFAISSLFYNNDLSSAFQACSLNSKYEKPCFNYLLRIYNNDLWYDKKIHFCSQLKSELQEYCLESLNKYGIA